MIAYNMITCKVMFKMMYELTYKIMYYKLA